MQWVPIVAWCAAGLIAVLVLGYCGYELAWKSRRLRRDVAALSGTAEQLVAVQGELAAARERIAAAGSA